MIKKYLEIIYISLLAVFAPIQATLITIAVLITADMVTGVIAAYKRGEKISSNGLRRTLSKILAYEVAIMAAFIAEKYIIGDVLPVSKLVATMACCVELKSLLENIDSISGNNAFELIVKKLGSSSQEK
jgi:hypothetical protein